MRFFRGNAYVIAGKPDLIKFLGFADLVASRGESLERAQITACCIVREWLLCGGRGLCKMGWVRYRGPSSGDLQPEGLGPK